MVKLKISNRSSIQLATLVVAVVCIALARGQPLLAMPFVLGAAVAVVAVQQLGKGYDRPFPWWLFLATLAVTMIFEWRV